MLSRGAFRLASSRTRRGIALSWSVLFILSLLLQYATFALAPAALAVHDEGLFELDGNAVSDAAPGEDWDHVFAGTSAAITTPAFLPDKVNSNSDDIFTGGSSKDINDTSDWLWTTSKPQAKNDITHAFAAAYTAKNADTAGDTIVYFGLNKYDASGDNFVGFWFLKGAVGPTGNGNPPGSPFSGSHSVGDILILADYTNGGGISTFSVYQWVAAGGDVSTHLDTVATGVPCTGAPATDVACGTTNTDTETSPWPFTDKSGEHNFLAGELFEGGIDLTALHLDTGCFTSFVAETRSSQSVTATLSDFAAGEFSFCVPPDISTQVKQDGQSTGSVGTVQKGDSVTDTATLTGSKGTVTGSVEFFTCFDANSVPDCSTGGTSRGTKTLSGGAATSNAFTPNNAGFYCYRVDYTPAAGSKYLAASHTNSTTECFKVVEAHIAITKTASPAGPVNAGDTIGFDITVTNTGDGTASGVHVSDVLPTGIDWSAGTPTGDVSGVTCGIAAGSLTCDDASMAAGDSFTVHISGVTDANNCGTVNNTASVTTTNDGSDEASASVDVLCAQIAITKVANPAGPVNAGDTIGFDITVTNNGDGTAANVSMTDTLPSGLAWSAGDPTGDTTGVSCDIAGGVLTCSDDSMAAGDSFSVHISATTAATDCGTVDNTASVTTSNDGSDEASASVDVLCPDVKVVKDAPSPEIPAGQDLVFKITTSNIGDGLAKDVVLKDNLPAGFDWTVDNTADCSIAAGVLTCDFGDLKAGDSITVTLTAPTSANAETGNIDCSEGGVTVDNTGAATSSNEGQDVLANNSDSASIDVLCSALFIQKSFTGNTAGTDPDLGVPAAKIGDTLHYTLEYAGAGLLENAFITDVLPKGLDYVDGSAAGDANFDFTSATFNSSTGRWTLRWDSPALSEDLAGFVSGAVTYDAKVLVGAPDEPQPLVNTATIDSDQTPPDSDTAAVAVLAPPEALTPPPTNTIAPPTQTSNPGFALMLILIGVAAMTLTIGFITPAPARATRRRNRPG